MTLSHAVSSFDFYKLRLNSQHAIASDEWGTHYYWRDEAAVDALTYRGILVVEPPPDGTWPTYITPQFPPNTFAEDASHTQGIVSYIPGMYLEGGEAGVT